MHSKALNIKARHCVEYSMQAIESSEVETYDMIIHSRAPFVPIFFQKAPDVFPRQGDACLNENQALMVYGCNVWK